MHLMRNAAHQRVQCSACMSTHNNNTKKEKEKKKKKKQTNHVPPIS